MDPHPDRTILYRLAFIRNCYILVLRGYEVIKAEDLSQAEETSITGELVRGMREALESERAEPWMQLFEVLDDPPQNVPDRLGRSRPRVDIEFVRLSGRGRRPRFHIEAKRLYQSDSVKEYFGDGGLGCFIVGRYAAQEATGGMLGYVQTDTTLEWLGRLRTGFAKRTDTLRVALGTTLAEAEGFQDIAPLLNSYHGREPATLGQIEIFHFLLEFLPPAVPAT
ncbi:MAG: hypothetical protein WAO35_18515 [Terriglobia bacterium]